MLLGISPELIFLSFFLGGGADQMCVCVCTKTNIVCGYVSE